MTTQTPTPETTGDAQQKPHTDLWVQRTGVRRYTGRRLC